MTGSATAAAAANRCFLCGAWADDVAWSENGYYAVACRCGLAFVQPPPADGIVDPTRDAHPEAFYRLPARRKVTWLRRHRGPGTLLAVNQEYIRSASQEDAYRTEQRRAAGS